MNEAKTVPRVQPERRDHVDHKDLAGLRVPRVRKGTKDFKGMLVFREGMAIRGLPGIRGSRAQKEITVLLVPRGTRGKREQEVSATSVGANTRTSRTHRQLPVVILR